jgi:phosphate acyltransferase
MAEETRRKLPIVLDAMGGDHAPAATVEGAILASREFNLPILLVGRPDVIEPELARHEHAGLPITVTPASEIIEMTDHPAQAAKSKKDSSMIVGLNLVKTGQASAFVSMGNTGGAMAAALFTLGRIKGIKRPAVSTVFPTLNGFCFILDIGANADCRPEYLVQFGLMGSIYAERVLDIPNPRVGIISNGEEEGKGNELVKETFPLLKQSGLNFVGNVEGKDVPAGLADVVVTDGFTGNVLVKSAEGMAKMMKEFIREEIYRTPISKLGGLLAKGAFERISKRTDYSEYGGAALLGVDGVVIIGHGRSNARAVRSALRVASQAVERQVVDAIRQGIK